MRVRRLLRYQRYKRVHGKLVWLVGPRTGRPRLVRVVRRRFDVKGRHLHRPELIMDDSFWASLASPA